MCVRDRGVKIGHKIVNGNWENNIINGQKAIIE